MSKKTSSEGVLVPIGDQEVSLQTVQDIYHTVTGKTETISRLLYDAHQVTLNDIERLHKDFEIAIEQYDCKASVCNISARYSDGRTEVFSGFNRFKLSGTTKPTPTESIEIEYDFLVLLPKTYEAKPYKLVIGVRSMLGVRDRHDRTKASEAERSMFYDLDRGTAKIEIHYVDLAVARTLEAVVEDWYRGLKKQPDRRYLNDAICKTLPTIVRSSIIIFSAMLLIFLFDGRLASLAELFTLLVTATAALLVSWMISIPFSEWIRKGVSRAVALSEINVSRADEELIENSKSAGYINFAKTMGGWIVAIAVGLCTTWIASRIGL